MKISFATNKIEKLCRDSKTAVSILGPLSAKKLQLRLSQLFAAPSVAELAGGRPHPLKHKRAGQFALDLHGGHRLIFAPSQEPPPLREDGSIDWQQVTDITIIAAEDYHD